MLMILARLGCSESFWAIVKVRSPHTGPEFGYPRTISDCTTEHRAQQAAKEQGAFPSTRRPSGRTYLGYPNSGPVCGERTLTTAQKLSERPNRAGIISICPLHNIVGV